jgi:hypothetical protein
MNSKKISSLNNPLKNLSKNYEIKKRENNK